MANYRVYEVAEELGVDSKQLILMLHQMDVRVRSHMSTVTDVQIARLRARLERDRRGTTDDGEAAESGTTRRRRRRVAPPVVETEPAAAPGESETEEAESDRCRTSETIVAGRDEVEPPDELEAEEVRPRYG